MEIDEILAMPEGDRYQKMISHGISPQEASFLASTENLEKLKVVMSQSVGVIKAEKALLSEVWQKAMRWAKKNKPTESMYKKAAFANCVRHLVEGSVMLESGEFAGPSVREFAVDYAIADDGDRTLVETSFGSVIAIFPDGRIPLPGNWQFDQAIKFCDPICFGPIMSLHRKAWEEQSHIMFDNDPEDLEILRGKSA